MEAPTQMQVGSWHHPCTQVYTRAWQTASTWYPNLVEYISTSHSSSWTLNAITKVLLDQIILRWGMAIQSTLQWWEDFVERAIMVLLSGKPPKTICGSGIEGDLLDWPNYYLTIPSFTGSYPITLTVAKDFILDMNLHMWPNGAIAVVHVEAVSQPPMVSWPHLHTMTTTQAMLTVSTPSHSPLALLLCWPSTPWT